MIRFAGLCRSRLHLVWTMVHARLYSARLFLEYCSTVGVRETQIAVRAVLFIQELASKPTRYPPRRRGTRTWLQPRLPVDNTDGLDFWQTGHRVRPRTFRRILLYAASIPREGRTPRRAPAGRAGEEEQRNACGAHQQDHETILSMVLIFVRSCRLKYRLALPAAC